MASSVESWGSCSRGSWSGSVARPCMRRSTSTSKPGWDAQAQQRAACALCTTVSSLSVRFAELGEAALLSGQDDSVGL